MFVLIYLHSKAILLKKKNSKLSKLRATCTAPHKMLVSEDYLLILPVLHLMQPARNRRSYKVKHYITTKNIQYRALYNTVHIPQVTVYYR